MGAAWREPKDRDLDAVCAMVEGVKALGLETCVTLGMLTADQARRLKEAGLDYYNHNLDTSPEFYGEIITTRTYQDRLDTLAHVREAGINVCCGGIVGMGETRGRPRRPARTRWRPCPSIPRACRSTCSGAGRRARRSPDRPPLDPFEFVRTIAAARITDAGARWCGSRPGARP